MPLTPYFATCARGLEPILADELRALSAAAVALGRGGVEFQGDLTLLYRANLELRTAVRVLQPILRAQVTSTDELYQAIHEIDWSRWMTPDHTLAVDCNVRDSHITHSQYAARRVKDAICDQFVERRGSRPSVDVERPMIGLNLHVYQDEAVLSLDSSGDSLHKRGYRPIQTRAPINEALAAALVLMSGFRGDVPFVDPLCGSGTLCIEAAWLALDRAPGLTRRHFGFMGWMDFDVRLWTGLRDQARRRVKPRLPQPIAGSDLRHDATTMAQNNARAAGIGHLLSFTQRDMRDCRPPEGTVPGVLLTNPPYGERLGEEKELRPLYRSLGEVCREHFAHWRCFVFTGSNMLARELGVPIKNSTPLFNGRIPCRLLELDVGARNGP
jgi:putative N6-adenine-specific DNA methylase